MKNYMISTDGVFGKKTDNGDVRLDHSGHYNIHKPDNVAVTDGTELIVAFPEGSTVLIENGKLTITCPE